ncbi:hypothetical protein [Anaerosacchariphilus polymeriproducens]|uniref:Uncharacterized protein n=1 Tax=Anaerosacchariphilus polymeriproducens TaxID=1812858 RepID=A0A371AVH0_9FIRM|nr:hypothetical protein [Anaerosacchariphilus polymeriproducens]RDU23574.1 hypothetical protein DWV06_09065 [Anaerosacchariphilus polymeriproducens]
MKRHFAFMRLFFFDGVSGKVPFLRIFIINFFICVLMSFIIGSTQSLVSTFLAFGIVGRVFNSKEDLSHNLSIDYKRQVYYALLFYSIILLCFFVINLFVILIFQFASFLVAGEFLNITSFFSEKNICKLSTIYNILLIILIYILYFPLIFIRKKNLWTIYLFISSCVWLIPNTFIKLYIVKQRNIHEKWFGVLDCFDKIKFSNKLVILFFLMIYLLICLYISMKSVFYFIQPVDYSKKKRTFCIKTKEEIQAIEKKKNIIKWVIIMLVLFLVIIIYKK